MAHFDTNKTYYLKLILIILLSFLTYNKTSYSATISSQARAEILNSLVIESKSDILFGTLKEIKSDGKIVISPNGTRYLENVIVEENDKYSSSKITINGNPNNSYTINIPEKLYLDDLKKANLKLLVNDFKLSDKNFNPINNNTSKLDSNGKDTIYVGATLNIPNNASAGEYYLEVPIKVEYN